MSALGQNRRFDSRPATSGLPRLADILRVIRHVFKVPILLQKWKVASARMFGETLKREAIDDSDKRSRVHLWQSDFCNNVCQFRKFVAPSIARQTGVAFAH